MPSLQRPPGARGQVGGGGDVTAILHGGYSWHIFQCSLQSKSSQNMMFRTGPALGKAAAITLKILVTGFCFWYVARQINLAEFGRRAQTVDVAWASLAIVAVLAQIPFVTLRWCAIIDALSKAVSGLPVVVPLQSLRSASSSGKFFSMRRAMQCGSRCSGEPVATGANRRSALCSIAVSALLYWRHLGLLSCCSLPRSLHSGETEMLPLRSWIFAFRIRDWSNRGPADRLFTEPLEGIIVARQIGASHIQSAPTVEGRPFYCPVRSSGPCLDHLVDLVHRAGTRSVVLVVGLGRSVHADSCRGTHSCFVWGWGVREATVVAVLTSQGLAAEQALFFSVCYGLTLLLGFLLGALLVLAIFSSLSVDFSANKRMLQDVILRKDSSHGTMD